MDDRKSDDPNLELHALFARMRAARLRRRREPPANLIERLTLKQRIQLHRRMPPQPSR